MGDGKHIVIGTFSSFLASSLPVATSPFFLYLAGSLSFDDEDTPSASEEHWAIFVEREQGRRVTVIEGTLQWPANQGPRAVFEFAIPVIGLNFLGLGVARFEFELNNTVHATKVVSILPAPGVTLSLPNEALSNEEE